jgi:hypothetical protein
MFRSVIRISIIFCIAISLITVALLVESRRRGLIPSFPDDQVLVYEVEFAERYPAIVAQWGSRKTVVSTRDVGCHSVSSNGRWLVVDNEGSSTVTIYDLLSGNPVNVLSVPDEMLVCEIDFDDTGDVVAFHNPFSRRSSYAMTLPDGAIVEPPSAPDNLLPADLLTVSGASFRTRYSPDGRRVLYAKCLLPFGLERYGCGPFWGYVIYDRAADEYHLPPGLNRWGGTDRTFSLVNGPVWSPDSQTLVYPLERLEGYETRFLVAYHVPTRIRNDFGYLPLFIDWWPLWSPDGKKILVLFQQPTDSTEELSGQALFR